MKKLLVPAFVFFTWSALFAQEYLTKNEYFYTAVNHLNLYVREDSAASNITVGLVFNCGAFLEDNEYDGLSFLYEKILAEKVRTGLKKSVADFSADTGIFHIFSATSFDYVFLRISTPAKHLDQVLLEIHRSVTSPIDSAQTADAAQLSSATRQQLHSNPVTKAGIVLDSLLWKYNYSKRDYILAWNDSTARKLPEKFVEMRQQYFCPGNSLLLIEGNVRAKDTRAKVMQIFDKWTKCTINLQGRFPGYNYKSLLTSRQWIIEDSTQATPFFQIAFQGPTPVEGVKDNFCALILATLLALPESAVHHYLKDSCLLQDFSLLDDKSLNLSRLSFLLTPDTACHVESWTYFKKFLTTEIDSLIDSTEIAPAKEALVAAFHEMKKNNREHALFVGRYWKSLGIDAYSTFEDSLRAITAKDMHFFLNNFIHGRKFVAALSINPAMRKESGIDSVFTSTAASITDYELHFLKNSSRFAGTADDSVFNSLVQFLKINPDIKIKVNGICHKSELLDVNDDAMLQWVRSQDYFLMNPPSLVQKKKFRLDVYRSLTLIKKLTEAGIPLTRMFGTGNLVRSPEEPEKHQAANCSQMF